jgi:hypothetical protein
MRFYKYLSFLLLVLSSASLFSQPTILDPCFSSGTPGTSFPSVTNLANVGNNSDLALWNGAAWTGVWAGANLGSLPPPINLSGCRAIWCGSGTLWTTGGEGFGIRLSSGLVTGTVYSFLIRYISHGTGSNGAFRPIVYTNSTPVLAGGFSLGNMPAVGNVWTSNVLTFTATAAQNGHVWLIMGTWPNFSSGFVNSFCSTCNPSVLPVELTHFSATSENNGQVLCQWTTSSEKDNKEFIIQRSKNAIDFFDIGQIESIGNTNSNHQYSFTDKKPESGLSYYRLKIIARDYSEKYSSIETINISEFSNSPLYPNPTTAIINLPAIKPENTNSSGLEIAILDYTGKLVLKLPYSPSINVSALEAGYYTLKILNESTANKNYKFVKE